MKLVGAHSRKELVITLSIWLALLACAIVALLLLQANALRIIDRINYVNVSRGQKAEVLYAEAEKNARKVLEESEVLNLESSRKVIIPAANKQLQTTLRLFDQAFQADIRPEFSSERTMYYELLGQVHDASGNHLEELLAHSRAFISQSDTTDALSYIQQAREASATSPEPVLLLAQLYETNNQIPESLAVLDDLYSSYPLTAKARWVKARVLLKTQQVDDAIVELELAVKEDGKNLTYRQELGMALAVNGKMAEAAEVMQPGLAFGGWLDASYLHMYGNYLMEAADTQEAVRVLGQADALAPNSGDVQLSLAKAYHQAGKSRQAASALRRATEIKPELHDIIF